MLIQKKKLSLILIFTLIFTFIPTGTYAAEIPFIDVSSGDWFYDDVKSAYETKLINGKTSNLYAPNDNMTAAEAVKLAACMHQLKNEGKVEFTMDNPWYLPYVDYAKKHNLITSDLNWNQNISRAGYMEIFANLIKEHEIKNIVNAGAIPDVPMSHPNSEAIYKLYRAGIVIGVDNAHNCNPNSHIKRSEVAAILTRMMHTDKRLSLEINNETNDTTPLEISVQPKDFSDTVDKEVTLQVTAKGGKTPLSYQWQRLGDGETNFSNISGTTNELTVKIQKKPYRYRCVIKDANGTSIASYAALVSEKNALGDLGTLSNYQYYKDPDIFTGNHHMMNLKITKQPQGTSGDYGETSTLSLEAVGMPPLRYHWMRVPDSGVSTDSGYAYLGSVPSGSPNLEVTIEETSYRYRCEVSDGSGKKLLSDQVVVKGNVPKLKITKQPPSYVIGKNSCKIEVRGVSTAPGRESYRWLKKDQDSGDWVFLKDDSPNSDGIYYDGVNTKTLVIHRYDHKEPPGLYDLYQCIIKDSYGNSKDTTTCRVFLSPETTAPGNKTPVITMCRRMVSFGDDPNLHFYIFAFGANKTEDKQLRYQWQVYNSPMQQWLNVSGDSAKTTNLTVHSKPFYYTKYRCIVTGPNNVNVISNEIEI